MVEFNMQLGSANAPNRQTKSAPKSAMKPITLSKDQKDDLRQMIRALENEQMSIVKVSEYLICYRYQSKLLAQSMTTLFEEEANHVQKGASSNDQINKVAEKRLLYFYVVNETLFKSRDASLDYVKAFGDQLHHWVQVFVNPTPTEDYFLLEAVIRVIQIWQDEMIFSKSFIDVLKQYLQPPMENARAKAGGGQAMMLNQNLQSPESLQEQNQARLVSQLKAINQCDEVRDAVRLELSIEKLAISDRLKSITTEITALEKAVKVSSSSSVPNQEVLARQKDQLDKLRSSLFELRKQQKEQIVLPSLSVMYKMASLVQRQRENYKQIHFDSCLDEDCEGDEGQGKLQQYMAMLQQKRQEEHDKQEHDTLQDKIDDKLTS